MEQQSGARNDLIFGILCYLGILWIIPLLMNKKSEFFRLHLSQGLVVLILEGVLYVLQYVPFLHYIAWWLWFLPGLISLLAIIKLLTGDTMYHLPVVYDVAKSFKF